MKGDDLAAGTSTTQALGQQKSLPPCIMTEAVISGALKTEQDSKTTKTSSRFGGS